MIVEVRRTPRRPAIGTERKYPGSRAFYAGTCHLCPKRDMRPRPAVPLSRPDTPSLESLGFDIGKTASELLGHRTEVERTRSSDCPNISHWSAAFSPAAPQTTDHGKREARKKPFQLERRKDSALALYKAQQSEAYESYRC